MTAPGRLPSDQRVRERAASDLNHTWLLEAGAGTGKTTVLLSRVLDIVKTSTPLDRCAIITFTEKAAGELKLKLRERLERMLSESSGTSWGTVLAGSLESLDGATVGTIHAFAASLLRERPVEAGVDPRFSVADELECAILMEETWERWIEKEMAASAPPLARALRAGIKLDQIRSFAFELVSNRDVSPPPPPAAPPRGAASDLEKTRDRILEGIARLSTLSVACVVETDGALRQIRDLERSGAGLKGLTGDALLDRLAALTLNARAGVQKNWRPAERLKQIKELVADLAAERDAAAGRARALFASAVAAWIREGWFQAYRAAKEERRQLDFTDILVICRNMLRSSRSARASFQQRYDCLLVDEFQDTDPLQAEILFLLAADDPDQSDWRVAHPKPGKLFVVGDPKQSIYRFRRADIETYDEARERIAASRGITSDGLTQNFRTVPSVVAWVNDLFTTLIREVPGTRYQPPYRPIEPWRDEPGPGSPRAILLTPDKPESLAEAAAAEVRRAEARHVIAMIRKGVEEGWPVIDPDRGASRPMRWRDVALLFRTGSALEIYEEELRERGVPYRLTGGRRYYMRAEMRALQAVLAAIDNPHDPLAVVSALRSPFFGHSDEELLSGAAAGAGWVHTRDRAGAGTPFERTFALLARLHADRNVRPPAAILEDLYEATGALALFYLKPDGDQRAANLLKAIDLARAHGRTAGSTFGSFARWLGKMADDERQEAEAPLAEEVESDPAGEAESSGEVRVLTIHKAKGLEYPMVVLCDISGRPRAGSPACVVERGGEEPVIRFRLGAKEAGFESDGYAEAASREKDRLEAEAIRLFYVAATRARDYLVIPVFAGKRSDGFHRMLDTAGFLPPPAGVRIAGGGAPVHRGARLLEGSSLDLDPRTAPPHRLPVAEADPPDPSLGIERDAWRRSAGLVLAAPISGRAFRSASSLEAAPRGGAAPPGPWRDRALARAVGTAVHGVLERIDLATGRDLGVLCEEEAARAGRPDRVQEVRNLAESALKSRIVKEALAAPRFYRELAVSMAGETFLSEDRIDLVFESGGAFTIVDFKTDQVATPEEIAARVEIYRPQALVYARVLGQVTGMPVSRVVFLFVRAGVEKSLKVDEAFLSAGRRLLETGRDRPVA